ncbi:hypothetical protein HPB52_004447 [Rhipicephalus sanguineus]|uniref:C2 domain-containing protein n=1 Tax=Rhipicephalus sanguineus TaxID=34632 RepID=A0A9D4PEM7_RHISA|nr:hypothetical protein HPB52_004447 [Rhipicephalus sanguineus]
MFVMLWWASNRNLSIFRDRGEDEEECGGCVRLSLPDVHMEDAGGGDGPSARLRRSPLVARAKSVDARAMPLLVHRLSISSERRTPSPETLPEPTSPRPRSLSPLLSPAPHAQDPASPIAMELGGPRMDQQGGAGGFGEPCVRVALLPEVDSKQRQALMRRRSTDPLFDETFKFPVSFDDVPSRTLLFQVFDYDRYSRNDVTGEVRVPLADVDVTTETEVWCDIEKTEKACEWSTNAGVVMQAKRDWPELLLSLSYLPSAGRLTVVILEAANLVPDSDKDKPGES